MILELTSEQIVTPGWCVIEREQRRNLSHMAASRARARLLRAARAAFEGHGG